jgi:hypothetical protein
MATVKEVIELAAKANVQVEMMFPGEECAAYDANELLEDTEFMAQDEMSEICEEQFFEEQDSGFGFVQASFTAYKYESSEFRFSCYIG